jgi:hypothetical protein
MRSFMKVSSMRLIFGPGREEGCRIEGLRSLEEPHDVTEPLGSRVLGAEGPWEPCEVDQDSSMDMVIWTERLAVFRQCRGGLEGGPSGSYWWTISRLISGRCGQ